MSNSRVSISPYPDVKQVNDERWVPPLPDAQKPTAKTRRCLGCDGVHGSVNVEMNCLREALIQSREEVKTLLSDPVREAGITLLQLRKEVAEIQSLPCSAGGGVEERRTGKRKSSSFAQG